MILAKDIKGRVAKAAITAKLEFVRIFGSSVTGSLYQSRDIDIVVGPPRLKLKQLSKLQSNFEEIFKRPVDLIQLRPGLSPQLVLEIARDSRPIWEAEKSGSVCYIEWIDRLQAVAQDEVLSFPEETRKKFLGRLLRKLYVS